MINLDRKTIQACNANYGILLHAYDLYNPHPGEISVRTLKKICQDELGKEISFFTANDTDELDNVRGAFFLHEDGTHSICIRSGLNNCWRRMVITKELFHVIFCAEENLTENLESHVEMTISDAPSFFEVSHPAVQLEFLAEYAAMEFLFPFSIRQQLIATGVELDFKEIALQYRVPRDYVERYLSNDYMDLCATIGALKL